MVLVGLDKLGPVGEMKGLKSLYVENGVNRCKKIAGQVPRVGQVLLQGFGSFCGKNGAAIFTLGVDDSVNNIWREDQEFYLKSFYRRKPGGDMEAEC